MKGAGRLYLQRQQAGLVGKEDAHQVSCILRAESCAHRCLERRSSDLDLVQNCWKSLSFWRESSAEQRCKGVLLPAGQQHLRQVYTQQHKPASLCHSFATVKVCAVLVPGKRTVPSPLVPVTGFRSNPWPSSTESPACIHRGVRHLHAAPIFPQYTPRRPPLSVKKQWQLCNTSHTILRQAHPLASWRWLLASNKSLKLLGTRSPLFLAV